MKIYLGCFIVAASVSFLAAADDTKGGPPTPPSTPAATSAEAPKKYKVIDIEQFDAMRKEKNAIVVDVRSAAEYANGHIAGATNIAIALPGFEQKVLALGKDKTLLVHCAVGVRSTKACEQLSKLDLPNLYNFKEGFDGWKKAGKPVEK